MGTIAELLGYSLSDAPVAEPASQGPAAEGPGDEGGAGALTGADRAREAVMVAVLAETGHEPGDARRELTLAGDLDLDTLGLYAVVSAVEHETRVTFTDEDIASWVTLGDLLDAVAAAV